MPPHRCPLVSPAVKPVGKPDAGDPHVRFDERGEETGRSPEPRLSSTLLLKPYAIPGVRSAPPSTSFPRMDRRCPPRLARSDAWPRPLPWQAEIAETRMGDMGRG